MIVVIGATGQFGRIVIEQLLEKMPAAEIIAAVRDPRIAQNLTEKGLQVRMADYSRPATLAAAFAGAEKVLLVSSSEVGHRVSQHQAVTDAARAAGVTLACLYQHP